MVEKQICKINYKYITIDANTKNQLNYCMFAVNNMYLYNNDEQ